MATKSTTIPWKTCGIIFGLSAALAAARWNWLTSDGSRWVSRAAVLLALLLLIVPRAQGYLRRCRHQP
jgi:hypothetical protein